MIWNTDESAIKMGKGQIFEEMYVMQRSLGFILEMLGIHLRKQCRGWIGVLKLKMGNSKQETIARLTKMLRA